MTQVSGLERIIESDETIEPSKRTLFLEMAKDFNKNFESNIFSSSILLEKEYAYGLDMWQAFLMHPQINRYISTYTNESITKQADANIMLGVNAREAVAVKKVNVQS